MDSLESALVGAVSSALANISVYPIDLSKTVIQSQFKDDVVSVKGDKEAKEVKSGYNGSTLQCLVGIYKEKGILGLYQGMPASILNSFVQTFFYFYWYTLIKNRYKKLRYLLKLTGRQGFSSVEELSLGIVAAILSQLFTTPITVISTRQQTTDNINDTDVRKIISNILKENDGKLHGFWKGLKVSMVLSINPSITYACYEKFKQLLLSAKNVSKQQGNNELSAVQNFYLGVISKMTSTIITQPLIVSKASLQSVNSRFSNFQDVLIHLYTSEGLRALWKGLGPQLAKGVIVQGLLFMFKGEITKCLKHLLHLKNHRVK